LALYPTPLAIKNVHFGQNSSSKNDESKPSADKSQSRSANSSALDKEYIIPKEFKPIKMPGSHFSLDNREHV